MGRFSLKRLFAGVTLAAIGAGIAWSQFRGKSVQPGLPSLLWVLGGTIAGAGIGQLPGRRIDGAALGAAIGTIIQVFLDFALRR